MALSKGKKIVSISMSTEKYKEFKKLAVEHDMQISDLLVTAGTITSIDQIKEAIDPRGSQSGK